MFDRATYVRVIREAMDRHRISGWKQVIGPYNDVRDRAWLHGMNAANERKSLDQAVAGWKS